VEHFPFLALLFIPLFAYLDRLVGSGEYGRSKPMIAAMLVGGVLGYLVFRELAFAFLGLAWAVWRSLPFGKGAGCPQTHGEIVSALFRQLLVVPIAAIAVWGHADYQAFGIMLVMVALLNTALRIRYGQMVVKAKAAGRPLESDFNMTVEHASGAAFGAACVGLAAWAPALRAAIGS
jgi:hypothetical protein